jgi:nucleoside-diphosphate-sugar epimerase
MKLLIIGGTRFLGRHLVAAALASDHEVTLFNRAQHTSKAPQGVETIQGDRNNDLNKLQGRHWNAVIDTCGYLPRSVRASAELLSDSVKTYVFISSQSVYADVSVYGVDESAPLETLTSEQLDKANAINSSGQISAMNYGELYGGLKAMCEHAVHEVMPGRALIIRPGVIVGPYDHLDRFTYWVVRVAAGGEVLAPGRPDRFVQSIDARDLADWIVKMIEEKRTGVYNADGLPNVVTMQDLLSECKMVSGSDASFTWADEDFLLKEEVNSWTDMPLWLPESEPQFRGFMFVNCDKAFGAGLTTRPLHETIRDTLTWYRRHHGQERLKAGIDPNRELKLLDKLRARQQ